MALLWLLVALLIIFAVVGGAAVNGWLFLILVFALVLLLVGAFKRVSDFNRSSGNPCRRGRLASLSLSRGWLPR